MKLSNKVMNVGLSLLTICLFLTSCFLSKKETVDTKVPELLDRTEKIRMGKEWDNVQNTYQELSLKIQEDKLPAHLDMALLFIQEARVTGEHGHYYPAALELLDQLLDNENTDNDLLFRALVSKAGVQLSLHDFNEALETGKKALALNPHNAQVHGVLTDAYVELGNYEKAVAHADRMISIKPDIRSYSRVSYLRQLHGDMQGALEAMEMAVNAGVPGREDNAWAALTYGELLAELGKYAEAKNIFEGILEVRPDYPFAVNAIGEMYEEMDKPEMAEKYYLEAIDIIPEVGFYINLVSLCNKHDRIEERDQLLDEILVMLDDDIKSGHNMNLELSGLYLELFENPEKALEIALNEYNLRPNNIHVNQLLSEIYVTKKDWKMAHDHFEKASVLGAHSNEILALQEDISKNISK